MNLGKNLEAEISLSLAGASWRRKIMSYVAKVNLMNEFFRRLYFFSSSLMQSIEDLLR
jgi:hypothetical protein